MYVDIRIMYPLSYIETAEVAYNYTIDTNNIPFYSLQYIYPPLRLGKVAELHNIYWFCICCHNTILQYSGNHHNNI